MKIALPNKENTKQKNWMTNEILQKMDKEDSIRTMTKKHIMKLIMKEKTIVEKQKRTM